MYKDLIESNSDLVEALLNNLFKYATTFNDENIIYKGIPFSNAQVRVAIHLIKHPENNSNMSDIAKELSLSRSNFTKIVNKLCDKGFLEKTHLDGNNKNYSLKITPLGMEAYRNYIDHTLQKQIGPLLETMTGLSDTYKERLRNALINR